MMHIKPLLGASLTSLILGFAASSHATTLGGVSSVLPAPLEATVHDGGHQTWSRFSYRRPESHSTPHDALELTNQMQLFGRDSYIGSFAGNDEQRLSFGIALAPSVGVQVMTGLGNGYTRSRQAFSQLNPYYFHGGSRVDFSYQGASLSRQLSERYMARLGSIQIEADDLERRSAQYAGIEGDNWQAHWIHVERGGDVAGRGLDLGWQFDWQDTAVQVSYQGLESTQSARLHQLGVQWRGSERTNWGLHYQTRENPLAEASGEQRVMMTYSRQLGRMPASMALSGGGFGKGLIIGAAALGAALLLSSGSDDQDSAPRLDEQHAAARQRLNEINPTSVRENREYGGWVYRTPDGRYAASRVVPGDIDSVSIPTNLVPAGNAITASLHTHGGDDPRYANEIFSPQDVYYNSHYRVDGYLGTPGGRFLWHDVGNNRIVQLGTISN